MGAKKRPRSRWYDRYVPLADAFDTMRLLARGDFNRIVRGLRDTLVTHEPELIDRTVLEYPLNEADKRRWYDKDPLCWLTVNALQYAQQTTIQACIDYLKSSLPTPAK